MTQDTQLATSLITYDLRGHVAHIQLNRPEKRNAFTVEMFREIGGAFARAEADPEVRCVLVTAAGPDFTTGLEFAKVAAAWISGELPFGEGDVDPWGVIGRGRTKPLVVGVHGRCFTLGLELALAADACVAAEGTRFALSEVRYSIIPAGGGTHRFIQAAGWSNAMRYVLTGDEFDVDEAYRLRLVQEVVPAEQVQARAEAIAHTIASRPPLAVQAALASARLGQAEGWRTEADGMLERIRGLLATEDAAEAMAAAMEGRAPSYGGQ